jgi:hypothetical protein
MATSGTTAFDLDFTDIIEEAYERAGLEMRSGYDLRTARRSFNLMMLEWANRGINLWKVKSGTQTLTASTATYTLTETDVVDLLDHVIRLNSGDTDTQTDYKISRISLSTYANRTAKLAEGRPTEIYIDRQRAAPQVTLWPVPDDSQTYTLAYWYLERIEDAGAYTNNADVVFRFLPALIAGLAYYIAMKNPSVQDRVSALKGSYDEQFQLASEEDREKVDWSLVPLADYTL